jgi:probable rRNA maturation factor
MLEIHNFTQNEIDEKLFQKVAEVALEIVSKESSALRQAQGRIEISLAIVGSGRIRRLNKMYRKKNRVTDVLSFSDKNILPYLAKDFPRIKKEKDIKFIEPPDGVKRLGEIIISYPQAKKQAKRENHSLERELAILLVHGILHLVGHEHEKGGEEKKEMKKKEKEILAKLT